MRISDWSSDVWSSDLAGTKRRVAVPFDAALRDLTEATAARLREVFATGRTPPAEYRADRCRACSLMELCRPKAVSRPARAWRDRTLAALLDDGAAPP